MNTLNREIIEIDLIKPHKRKLVNAAHRYLFKRKAMTSALLYKPHMRVINRKGVDIFITVNKLDEWEANRLRQFNQEDIRCIRSKSNFVMFDEMDKYLMVNTPHELNCEWEGKTSVYDSPCNCIELIRRGNKHEAS